MREQLGLFEDSFFETNETLTKKEIIAEILKSVDSQLQSGNDELILEVAKLVGLDITGHSDGHGLFWKKVSSPT
jgi:hypothetical protein